MQKHNRQSVHGVVLLDKPSGMSSNRALQRVKHLLGARKAGHTGSLDPLATGLLPICLGQATKLSEYLLHSHKRYITTIRLGITTDTLDSDGQVLTETPVSVSDEALQAALQKFRGDIEQVPPMYSALKKGGQPLYKLARKGETIERPARQMTVFDLQASWLDDLHLELSVHCSSGFYIRSLADDLGRELGCGAHVVALRRTAIKGLQISSAVTLEQLENLEQPASIIQPVDSLISDFPLLQLNDTQVSELKLGRRPDAEQLSGAGLHRFYDPQGELFAVGEITENQCLKTHKMIVLDA